MTDRRLYALWRMANRSENTFTLLTAIVVDDDLRERLQALEEKFDG